MPPSWFSMFTSTLLWTVLVLAHSTEGDSSYPVCQEKRSSCSCMTDQGLIDLDPLDSKTLNEPRFKDIRDSSTADTYYYNPCTPFTKNDCSNVALCQVWPADNPSTYWDFGEHSEAVFQNDETTQQLQIHYKTITAPDRSSVIVLECDESDEMGTLTFVSSTAYDPMEAKLTLKSKYACPGGAGGGGGVSVGTVLCILFAVIVVFYIVLGVTYMHCVKGAEGV